ncbi:helix-turn-helix domain-containing protein [uncultured Thiohalocapsa sp.]|uniref:helix-turn-helix domain-containing protein n=1 Tax=uncultured Thiohalocapsa sp. TaxID=768990 RepID=UPI0025CE5543|nr:helix-turn-helix transcriptional regulator [uncultured Thiohalocapsa sp.]
MPDAAVIPMKTSPKSPIDGARLRAARERAGLSQIEVSQRLGLSRGACGEWERGEKAPQLATFAALCRLLEVTPNHLLGFGPQDQAGRHSAAGTGARPRAGASPAAGPAAGPEAILADDSFPDGLRALADSVSHQAALRITPPEWAALASLDLPGGLTREGYIGLLVLLRAAAVQRSYAAREPAPAPFDEARGEARDRMM